MVNYDENVEATEEEVTAWNLEGSQIASHLRDILLEAGFNVKIAIPPISVEDNSINNIKTDGCVVHDIEFTCCKYESEYVNAKAKELLNSLGKQNK